MKGIKKETPSTLGFIFLIRVITSELTLLGRKHRTWTEMC